MTLLELRRDRDAGEEDNIVVLSGATWADFERMLEMRGEHSAPRFAFDGAELEIMSPGSFHESIKSIVGCLVEAYCLEVGIEFWTVGAWTQKRAKKKKGAEPDECYVFGERRKRKPDLAIEVVWTSGRIDKLRIYEAVGIPEVWYWREGVLSAYVLGPKGYKLARKSKVLPGIDLAEIASLVDRPTTSAAIRAYQALLRTRAR